MSAQLIYVMGPSGAGKDSVLQGLRQTWEGAALAHWARRTITRAVQEGGEQHEPMDEQAFQALQLAGAFAMVWQANGLRYGVRHNELVPLQQGRRVFVNGSRAYLSTLLKQWPQAMVVSISASHSVRAARLSARGRESAQDVALRLAREVLVDLPQGAICIDNSGSLADAVMALCEALQKQDV